MKVVVANDLTEAEKKFQKDEWLIADIEHYGKEVNWEEHEAYFIKIMDGERIAGILDLFISHKVAKIKDLIVDHNRKRQGIGKQLILEAEKIARKSGAHRMYLDTGKDWQARKFYEAMGYEVEGTLRDYSFHKDFVFYSKKV